VLTAVALVAAAVLAAVDWVGVLRGDDRRLRWIGKPGTMVALVVAALAGGGDAPGGVQAWFVVALVLSLAGDVFLLLDERWFLFGLGSFLVAHLAYVAGLWTVGIGAAGLLIGLAVTVAATAVIGRRIVRAARAADRSLGGAVAAYLVVIGAMVVAAFGTGEPLLVVAALLFYTSDAVLGWDRFTARLAWAPITVMVTYHAAQACFVVWLVTA
jgi:uncharacterized membrane protein YhhN